MSYLEFSPAKYHLSPNKKGLEVAVHKSVMPDSDSYSKERMDEMGRQLGLSESWINPTADAEWGYGRVLTVTDSANPDWLIIGTKYPKSQTLDQQQKRINTVQTFFGLFTHLNSADLERNSNAYQNIEISIGLGNGMGSPWLTAAICKPMVPWLIENKSDKLFSQVRQVMIDTHKNMWGSKDHKHLESDFKVFFYDNRWLYLKVFGNACDLSPDRNDFDDIDGGYVMTPHNIDNTMQQLSLLNGVAQLDEMAAGKYYRLSPEI